MVRLIVFLLTLVLLLTVGACNRDDSSQTEQNDRLLALRGGPVAFQCKEIDAFIPKREFVEGETCQENKAVVNGWSLLCLVANQCNTPARLAELNQAAEAVCAEWCAKKKCDYQYTKREKCDSSRCVNFADCQKNCNVPFRDQCYFQQAAPNFNCQCRERIQGRSTPLETHRLDI